MVSTFSSIINAAGEEFLARRPLLFHSAFAVAIAVKLKLEAGLGAQVMVIPGKLNECHAASLNILS